MKFYKAIRRLTIISSVLFAIPALVQAQLSLDGELRPRTEYRNGYRTVRTADMDPAFFTSQRARLTLQYKTDLYKIKVAGQDVRTWGEVAQLQDNPNVNIHEVWAQLKVTDAMDLKLGRQELIYDDHRLLGSVNWTQQARSHDALVVKVDNNNFKLDLGAAYNQEAQNVIGNTYTMNNYKVLSYLWLHKKMDAFNISVIGITDGFQVTDATNFRYTYGTHLAYNKDAFNASGSIYLQNGDDNMRTDISAWMYAVKAGYNFGSFGLTAGYDYLSGGSVNDNNPQRNVFNTLYATNHKFYGNMDYFLNVPNDTQLGGLQDIYLKATYTASEKTTLSLTYHNFALAEEVSATSSLDKGLGAEFDFNLSHSFSDDIALKMGYSLLSSTDSMERIKGVPGAESTQHWGWVMLSVTPSFIK
ncbi:porin [Fodinibius halophilus]|uniref:Porin n=1 Tax=Fodinibius halophilus TaxID=1736908 RepID=A0A6M1SZU0_9BACT|nr:porin [Fodinibius halophilus]NGP88786.1 porin [Fodinibius halophilus]